MYLQFRTRLHRLIGMHSFWKPIQGPVYDWPLTVCDSRTVDYDSDTVAMDVVAQAYTNENTRISHNASHRWYYWDALMENEAVLFLQSDSDAEDRAGNSFVSLLASDANIDAGVPHTAFVHPRASDYAQCRQSIEARIFAYFE